MSAPDVMPYSVAHLARKILANNLDGMTKARWANVVATLSVFFSDESTAKLQAAAPGLLATLERVVAESSKPSNPDAERWDQDITKPDHWVQEALAKARTS